MKKMFMAVIALMMTISASAQFYLYCSDGNVIKIDSISMIAPGEPEKPDTPTEPEEPTNPSAGIGVFSVAEGRTVTFSKGNLQYHPANDEWRFAESQLDYIGAANSNCSSTYNGWLDLFGWSTSTTNFGVSTSTNVNDYSGDFVDWGINQIGDDAPNTWRTLTKDEWLYIFNHRKNAQSLFAGGNVNGVNGLILLPDSWVTPDSLSFEASINKGLYWEGTGYYNPSADNYTHNVYTSEEWEKLEQSGAVFLPASGARKGTNIYAIYYDGYVWSSTNYNEEYAYYLLFGLRRIGPQDNYFTRDYAFPVRLVQDIQLE